jgi:hypothetical protein
VRRGYDTDEVDAYIASLERRLATAEAAAITAVPAAAVAHRQATAVEVGTVLIDARDAAERIRADAEVAAAQTVADAERDARQVVDEGLRRAEHEAAQRLHELDVDRRSAESAAAELRDATTRALSQISEWRGVALASLERVVAALEQWPGTVPDPVSLEEVLGSSHRSDEGDRQ